MRKILSLVIILILLVVTACGGPYNSVTSYLHIVEKGYSKDSKEKWIIAYDPYNKTEQETLKIIIEEPMVWNLIEIDKEYFASYSNEKDKDWILEQIEHFDDDDTLR